VAFDNLLDTDEARLRLRLERSQESLGRGFSWEASAEDG
jgi:hypothetical protein